MSLSTNKTGKNLIKCLLSVDIKSHAPICIKIAFQHVLTEQIKELKYYDLEETEF